MGNQPVTLAAAISEALAAHDPLDPWLVNSNYDEGDWDAEAGQAAPAVAEAKSVEDVYTALVDALRPSVRPPESDEHVRDRIWSSAQAVWRCLQAHPLS